MSEFAGRTVLITGALGTLGTAQAEAFGRLGARLLLLDRPGDPWGDERARELATRHGVVARYIGQDLGELKQSEALVRGLSDEYGGIEVLVSNAALIINKPFEEFSIEEYEDQLRVNSAATFALARAVAPAMKQKRDGKIVNFCSVTLNGRWDGYVPYVASKGAMLGLTKSLARELGPFNVRVNAVSPGAVVSDAENRVFADRLQQYHDWILENQCLKDRIQAADVADLVVFLASDRSRMITGQNISVDGGW
ncbi:MAG: SDR family oxidoreductase [Devosia sp.]|uniref:SDR family oxidoreductase n=1 Tax=Devosia sp. TaxID=1871048 RepID=UPI001AC5D1DC|nr:SDR family oxidoreductase [Devosia sp.]MBN9315308.1 SDR family oxidoreductase [Devosia sp.]